MADAFSSDNFRTFIGRFGGALASVRTDLGNFINAARGACLPPCVGVRQGIVIAMERI